MHSYQHPALVDAEAEVGLVEEIDRQLLNNIQTQLNKVIAGSDLEGVEYRDLIVEGHLIDATKKVLHHDTVDLVVMGTKGATGIADFLGSNTSRLISETNFPVLVVPEQAQYISPKNILFASDYHRVKATELKPLVELAKINHAEIHILHIGNNRQMRSDEIQTAQTQERLLKTVRHTYHFINTGDVIEGINHYTGDHKIDMVAALARRHNLVDRVFKKSISKKMALHTSLPLLVMSEQP